MEIKPPASDTGEKEPNTLFMFINIPYTINKQSTKVPRLCKVFV